MAERRGGHYVKYVLCALCAVGLIGWIDYWTGPDIAFSLFYLPPVLAAGWWLGKRGWHVTAVAASLSGLLGDFAWHGGERWPLYCWNALSRLGIFLFAGFVTAQGREGRDRLASLNARLRELLEHERAIARTDPLTQLANSRAFQERVATELASQTGRPGLFGVACLDLDDFKTVNDLHGHLAGDCLLASIGEALREVVRSDDLAARLGGDEFAIVFMDVQRQTAERIGERLVERVQELGGELGVRASIGIALFRRRPLSVDDALRRADEAMYRAKAAGKGRVEIWEQGQDA